MRTTPTPFLTRNLTCHMPLPELKKALKTALEEVVKTKTQAKVTSGRFCDLKSASMRMLWAHE